MSELIEEFKREHSEIFSFSNSFLIHLKEELEIFEKIGGMSLALRLKFLINIKQECMIMFKSILLPLQFEQLDI